MPKGRPEGESTPKRDGAEGRPLSARATTGSEDTAPSGRARQRTLPSRTRGFTLIEILVALALLAVALAAGMRALAHGADGASTLKARTLALWVAQNRLAAAQIEPATLDAAETRGEALQAGMAFVWTVRVSGTPNPAFRRIDIGVAERDAPDYVLARLTGYIARSDER
jgi:general secretion pathway protein I